MMEFIVSGLLLGLAAGFAPGPLSVYVISESLKNGFKHGFYASLSPLVTDAPIVLMTFFFSQAVTDQSVFIKVITVIGAIYLAYLSVKTFTNAKIKLNADAKVSGTLLHASMVNALSPHPYLFWLLIGSPILIKAHAHSVIAVVSFLGCFYVLLIAAKVLMSAMITYLKRRMTLTIIAWANQFLALLLGGFALFMLVRLT